MLKIEIDSIRLFAVRNAEFESLEELDRLFLGVLEQLANPAENPLTSFLKFVGVALRWGVKLDTVTTVLAIRDANDLVQSLIAFPLLSGPPPGIFHTVGKEDVGYANVPTALIDRCLVSTRLEGHTRAE